MSTLSNEPVLEITHSILTEAAQRPWLAALLMRRSSCGWLTRLAHLAQRVRNLPRHTRRALWRKLASGLAAVALLLALSGPPQTVYATSITVDSGAAGLATDGKCSVVEAIVNANADAQTWADCPAGSGTDTISLPASATFSYSSAAPGSTSAALPNITSPIVIEGNNSTIQRTGGPNFRLIYISGTGNLTLTKTTLTGGQVANGGGLQNYGTLNLLQSTVSANNGLGGQGGGIQNVGTLTVNQSTISNNQTPTGNGGGIYVSAGAVTITDSTISGNSTANFGGGMVVTGGTVSVYNSTFTGNSSTNFTGGIGTQGGTTSLYRSIVSGNTASDLGNEIGNFGGTLNANAINLFGHSGETNALAFVGFTRGATDITATSDGTNPTALASILDTTLANNGTQPHPFTHALVSGSPAIDQISKATCDAAPVNGVDQRGGWRANGTGKGGTDCDIGAYEYNSNFDAITAVILHDLTATTNPSPGLIGAAGAALASLAALGAWVIGRRKAAARQRLND